MPYLTRPFYRKHLQNKVELEKIKNKELTKLKKTETALIEAKTEQVVAEKKAENIAPELIWEKEFLEFKKGPFFPKFKQLIVAVYEHGGRTEVLNDFKDSFDFKIDQNLLVFADSHELINLYIDQYPHTISFTEKGRYFLREYSDTKENSALE